MDSFEVVPVKVRLFVCQSSSLCPQSHISVWLHNRLSCRRGECCSASRIQSCRHTVSATCTVLGTIHSYLLSSLSPSHLLCICFFCSPTVLRFMSPSLSLLRLRQRWPWWTSLYVSPKTHKTPLVHRHVQQHADTQMFSSRQMWNLWLISTETQLDLV